jgi:Predicted hydrolases or acyltransferases (alpha/beta hydrolase superfamily)
MPQLGEPVVLVHGLWMNGLEFGVLRHRLQARHGFDVHVFPYASMHGSARQIADELADFARRCAEGVERVHLVGHSLGGAFVFRALEHGLRDHPGNAVLMGSPLNGSRAAAGAARIAMLRSLLGPHVIEELATARPREWPGGTTRGLGAIAGSRRLGLGQFFARFDADDNDGTIAITETVIPGLDDHIVLPHSHMGMLFAHDVADQVAHFLRSGRFAR